MVTNISTIQIKSTVQRVWDCITRADLVKRWQYGSDLITSWETGSDIKFSTAWGDKVFEQWGKILEVIPCKLIRYSLFVPGQGFEDKPENYFIMHYVLTDENGHTLLEIIQEDPRHNAVQEAPQGEENPVLKSLKELSETG